MAMTEVQNKQDSIAVVGAGIVGICSALYLQKAGFKVTIYDKEGVSQGASKGNAGHFATEQIFPLADMNLLPQVPKMLLDPLGPFRIKMSYLFKALPWFVRFLWNMRKSKFEQNKLALKALNQASMPAYQPLIEAAGLKHLFYQEGSLLVSEQKEPKALKQVFESFESNGIAVSFLQRKQLLAIEPNLSNKVNFGIYFKDVGHTADPELLAIGLFDYFISQGGRFCKTAVKRIYQASSSTQIVTAEKSYVHDKSVIATGAWSKPLAEQLGYSVPLDTERGYHLMLPEQNRLSIPVVSLERKFIMTPMLSGLRLAGTVEFAGLNAPANDARAHALLPHANALLTEPLSHKAQALPNWMGFRPSLPDSLPVICQAPQHNSVYFAFGHQHLGLTQAAITGQLVAELIQGKPTSLDLSPYCISRFQ